MCKKDLIFWRLRSLAYSTTTVSLRPEMKKRKKKIEKGKYVDIIVFILRINQIIVSKLKDTEQANRSNNSRRFLPNDEWQKRLV